MWRLFDFKCQNCGNLFEEMIADDTKSLPCTVCAGNSSRQLAAPRADWKHMGLDPGFPTAYEKWGDAKREHHLKDKGGSEKGQNLKMY